MNKYLNRVIHADVLDALVTIPNNTIACAITSPPYWGQRDYEFKGQIGLEDSYKEYITKSVLIYRNLRNTLKDEGVFFLNIGDKYISKYGNAPMGMIPFKLAYQMKRDGWILEDILIWYKPNHMPSSIKNRFSNTYEPIFIFSKCKDNYYRDYANRTELSKIIPINLQRSPYHHMAVYPEKLIEKLLSLGIPKYGIILDPFAGTGTTGKACLNLNEDSLRKTNFSFIMVEANPSYIDIILERCRIKDVEKLERKNQYKYFSTHFREWKKDEFKLQKGCLNISHNSNVYLFNNPQKVYDLINTLKSVEFKRSFQEDGIIYVGIKNFTIEQLNSMANLNKFGWVIRNLIIQKINKRWFPVFMIVKDTKRINYQFNLDEIRISHRNHDVFKWWSIDFIGYKVVDNYSIKNTSVLGKVSSTISHYQDGMPSMLEIKWGHNNYEKLPVVHKDHFRESIKYYCPECNSLLFRYYNYNTSVTCKNCGYKLWKSKGSIPKLVITHHYCEQELTYNRAVQLSVIQKRPEYSGKFKNTKRINLGASPGARSSTQEPYFSVQRLYKVYQPMICDYLNIHRIELDLSKSDLTSMFGRDYKHTVGHWLRKDMGGSIPNINDWMKLKEIFGLDDQYTRLVCEKGLKLQVVKASHKGKNPGDFHKGSIEDLKKMLVKSYQF